MSNFSIQRSAKKIIFFLFFAALSLSSYAQTSADSGTLKQIETNTRTANNSFLTQILSNTNSILTKMDRILEKLVFWEKEDKEDQTSKDQQFQFSQYSDQYLKLLDAQSGETNKNKIMDTIFKGAPDPDDQALLKNTVSYFSVLNSLYVPESLRSNDDKKTAYKNKINLNKAAVDYILNASSANISHEPIQADWNGSQDSIARYLKSTSTATSIQSYNAYVLSNLYLQQQSNLKMKDVQRQLLVQATDSEKWFKVILSEKIPTVIRQILMYESQNYVLLTQLLEVERQQLAAQVMTNSLLILNNQAVEDKLAEKAKSKTAL